MDRNELLKFLPKNSVGAELGVYLGEFSDEIIKAVNPKRLFLIDVWEFIELGYNDKLMRNNKNQLKAYRHTLKKFIDDQRVSLIREKTEIIKDIFPQNYLDWIYIDADHSYNGCMNDLVNSDPLVKEDGCILGHDYNKIHFPGVVDAVNEFVKTRNYNLTFITTEKHQCHTYLITKNLETHRHYLNAINSNKI